MFPIDYLQWERLYGVIMAELNTMRRLVTGRTGSAVSDRSFSGGTWNPKTVNQIIAYCMRCSMESNTSGMVGMWRNCRIRSNASRMSAAEAASFLPLMRMRAPSTTKKFFVFARLGCGPRHTWWGWSSGAPCLSQTQSRQRNRAQPLRWLSKPGQPGAGEAGQGGHQ